MDTGSHGRAHLIGPQSRQNSMLGHFFILRVVYFLDLYFLSAKSRQVVDVEANFKISWDSSGKLEELSKIKDISILLNSPIFPMNIV